MVPAHKQGAGWVALSRIDNDGDHNPGSCRWATGEQQRESWRRVRGYTCWSEKLSTDDLQAIQSGGCSKRAISAAYGSSSSASQAIKNG